MKVQDYKTIYKKTAKFPTQVDNFGLAYVFLGLLDEFEELLNSLKTDDIDLIYKEAGDVYWYALGICNEAELDFDAILNDVTFKLLADVHDFEDVVPYGVHGMVKKYYRDNKPLDKIALIKLVYYHLAHTTYLIVNLTKESPYNVVSNIMDINYKKLTQRLENDTIHGDGDNR